METTITDRSKEPAGQLRQNPGVAWRLVDGQAVLVASERGCVFVLNDLGSRLWRALESPRTPRHLVREIAADHPERADQIEDDVRSFLFDLESRELIETCT